MYLSQCFLSTLLSPHLIDFTALLFQEWGPGAILSLHSVTEGKGRWGGKQQQQQLLHALNMTEGEVSPEVLNIL